MSAIAAALLRRTLRPTSSLLRRHLSHTIIPSSAAVNQIAPGGLARVSSVFPRHFASASSAPLADTKLTQVLEEEIVCAKGSDALEITLPDELPFEIIDNPGDQTVTLKREFAGQSIEAIVFMNIDEDAGDDQEYNSDDEAEEGSNLQTISMVVTMDKGESHIVEFCCLLSGEDDFLIESMKLKKRDDPDNEDVYQGPEFSELDESLQKAAYKYLEERGIKNSLYDFLYQYMLNKDSREYLTWLKNMKQFVEA